MKIGDNMLVTLNEVTVSYTDKKILDNVSFSINDNDKIGIVGINGTGKSTLLKTILGEVDIQSGEIFRKSGIKLPTSLNNQNLMKTRVLLILL